MAGSLLGPGLKVSRANLQLKRLTIEVDRFIRREPYAIVRHEDVNTEENSAIVYGIMNVREGWPAPLSIILGEIIHDLRSALDHLVWQLVIKATATEPVRKTGFPIYFDQGGYDSDGERLLDSVDADARQIIRKTQPFYTGEGKMSPLWLLHELSNIDKHHCIYGVGAIRHPTEPLHIQYDFPGEWFIRTDGKFKHGEVFFRVVLHPSSRPIAERVAKVQMNSALPFYVSVDQPIEWRGIELIQAINSAGRRVSEILKTMKREIF